MTVPGITIWREAAAAVFSERFQSKINRTDECWLWTAAISTGGYGVFMVRKGESMKYAHRLAHSAYTETDIPAGQVSDHLCRVRSCVNPEHIEIVSQSANLRRGLNGRLKTTCAAGHPWIEHRVTRPDGKSRCALCARARNAAVTAAVSRAASSLGMAEKEFRSKYGRSKSVLIELGAWVG